MGGRIFFLSPQKMNVINVFGFMTGKQIIEIATAILIRQERHLQLRHDSTNVQNSP